MKKLSFIMFVMLIITSCSQNIDSKIKRIHKDALTIDTHCDTPMRFMGRGFDPGVKHESRKNGSKVDFTSLQKHPGLSPR